MKLSPATIFILLLIFLVLSVLLCRWGMREVDGFIGYKFDTPPLETVILPMYSDKNKLHKMYDSLYFDNINGNIVEIDATAYADASGNVSGTIDSSGSTITALHVLPRIGNSVKSYKIDKPTDVIPTPATTTDKSYQSKVYPTISKVTDSYTAFMMPWHDNTYVHIMNNSASKPENIGTYAFTNGSSAQQYDYTDNAAMVGVDKSRPDTNTKNNTLVIDPIYNTKRKVYQISEFVKYDISNSNILVSVGDKEIKVYSRNASNAQTLTTIASNQETTNGDDQTSVASINFAPRVIYDLCGQNMIVYVPSAKKTLVALVCYNTEVKLDLRNVCRFNENGLDMGEPASTTSGSDDKKEDKKDDKKDDKKEDKKDDKKEDKMDDKKMLDYGGFDMNDYMLKTQIIPPVCPACPSCNYNNGGACNQCGGNGGCGTRTSNGDSLVTGGNPIRGAIDASGNVAGGALDASGNIVGGVVNAVGNVAGGAVNAVGNVAGGAVNAVGNVAGGAVNAVGNVAGGAVNAAGNVLNTTVDTAGNVVNKTIDTAGNVVNKTVGAATDVATGALGAVGNVASSALGVFGNVLGGAGNMLPSGSGSQGGSAGGMRSQQYQPMSAGMSQQYPVSGSTSTTDPYSYQGALPIKKPTDFMPITADFSSFSR
jgi:hypothetical protein